MNSFAMVLSIGRGDMTVGDMVYLGDRPCLDRQLQRAAPRVAPLQIGGRSHLLRPETGTCH
jgi:hypothetical protein